MIALQYTIGSWFRVRNEPALSQALAAQGVRPYRTTSIRSECFN